MVAKMYDISASTKRPGDHRLPRVLRWFYQNVQGSDIVGISSVVTSDTLEHFSHSVFFGHQPTLRAHPRGVFGIDQLKTNTVLLSQKSQPCTHLTVCPWGHRFTEFLSSVTFSSFHVLQVLYLKDPQKRPRNQFTGLIYVALTSSSGSFLSLGTGLFPLDLVTDLFEVSTEELSLRGSEHFELTNIYPEGLPGLGSFFLRDIDPEDSSVSFKVNNGTLFDGCSGFAKPVVETFMGLEWYDYGLSGFESRDFKGVVEGLFTRLYLTYEGAERDCVFADRDRRFDAHQSGIGLSDGDDFESYFKSIRSMSIREGAPREPIESFGIKLPRVYPEGPTEEVDSGSDFSYERVEGSYFGVRGEVEGDGNRTDHVGHKISWEVIRIKDKLQCENYSGKP